MTGNLEKLSEMASEMWTEKAVSADDIGFVLELGDVKMSFFSHDGLPNTAFCRAVIASLGEMKCPGEFAEEALAGNFFWSGICFDRRRIVLCAGSLLCICGVSTFWTDNECVVTDWRLNHELF